MTTKMECKPGEVFTTCICDQDLQWHNEVRIMVMRPATFEDYESYCAEVGARGPIVDLPGYRYYQVSVD